MMTENVCHETGCYIGLLLGSSTHHCAVQLASCCDDVLRRTLISIGVIYGYEWYRYPHFLDWGVQYPSHFRTKSEEFSVTCCQQKRSAVFTIKTIFGRSYTSDPRCESSWRSLRSQGRMRRGYFLPILLPFRLMAKGRIVLRVNWYPWLFWPKLRPCWLALVIEKPGPPSHSVNPGRAHSYVNLPMVQIFKGWRRPQSCS